MARLLRVLVLCCVVSFAGAACTHHHKGPAERAGESIDRGLGNTGRAIEDLGDSIEDGSRGGW